MNGQLIEGIVRGSECQQTQLNVKMILVTCMPGADPGPE